MLKVSRDTNNNVVVGSLKLIGWVVSKEANTISRFNLEDLIPILV